MRIIKPRGGENGSCEGDTAQEDTRETGDINDAARTYPDQPRQWSGLHIYALVFYSTYFPLLSVFLDPF